MEKDGLAKYLSISTYLSASLPVFIICKHALYVCGNVWVCALAVINLPIAVEYPGDIEQSLQQPSAVNERMESATFPLNSLSLYWTWWCRLITDLSHRYFAWLIWVLIKKRRWWWCMCVGADRVDERNSVHSSSRLQEVNGWSVWRLIGAAVRKSLQPNLIKAVVYILAKVLSNSLFLSLVLWVFEALLKMSLFEKTFIYKITPYQKILTQKR